MLPERQGQNQYIKGWKWTYFLSVIALTGIYGLLGASTRASVVLITCAMLPGIIICSILWMLFHWEIQFCLVLELFWSGAIISTLLAVVIEIFGQAGSRPVWDCEKTESAMSFHTFRCSVLFVIAMTVVVGLSEEFAKIVPLSRVKCAEENVPFSCWWWWRCADNPIAFMVCGASSACGFAFAENIGYVTRSNTDYVSGMIVALIRALTSIPFHVMCTSVATSVAVCYKFEKRDQGDLEMANANNYSRRPPFSNRPGAGRDSSQQMTLLGGPAAGGGGAEASRPPVPAGSPYVQTGHQLTLAQYVLALLYPAVCHGLYDSFLYLAEPGSSSHAQVPEGKEGRRDGAMVWEILWVINFGLMVGVSIWRWTKVIKLSRGGLRPRTEPVPA